MSFFKKFTSSFLFGTASFTTANYFYQNTAAKPNNEYYLQQFLADCAAECFHPVRYEEMVDSGIFFFLKQGEYEDLGCVARGEEKLTVLDNAYTQMGILVPNGVRHLVKNLPPVTAITTTTSDSSTSEKEPVTLTSDDIFCDVGSGYGNINIQLFSEFPIKKSYGIDILPSRIQQAQMAAMLAVFKFPALFNEGDRDGIEFVDADFVDKKCDYIFNESTVIFSHSHMFEDHLMKKLGDRIIKDSPNCRLVISSRKIPQMEEQQTTESQKWKYFKMIECEADWNDKSPMHVYQRE